MISAWGGAASLIWGPFIPLVLYYFFTVFRPQVIWKESLAAYPDFQWALMMALPTIGATFVWRFARFIAPQRFVNQPLPRPNIGHFVFAFFALWITVTYLTSRNQLLAEPIFSDYRKIFLMFFISAMVLTSIRQIWIIYLVVLGSLSYIAFEVNQYYFFNNYLYLVNQGYSDIRGGGLDNNGAALMLAMGFPMCVYAWDGVKHWIRWLFPVCAMLIVHAVLTSYSRGAMLSILITVPFYIFRCQSKRLILVGYLVGAMMLPFLVSDEIAKRFMSITSHEEDESAGSRKTTWAIAWNMANERPIFGYGIRNSSLYTYQFGADEEGRVIHNNYLQIAADSGMIALAGLLAIYAVCLYLAAKIRWSIPGSNSIVGLLLAAGHTLTGGRWQPISSTAGYRGKDAHLVYAMACGIEGSLICWMFGSFFLSLETFEPPYVLEILVIQLWSILQLKRVHESHEFG
ncbi:MAG: O-antigen ligase family protein [Zavarzinella sp.]